MTWLGEARDSLFLTCKVTPIPELPVYRDAFYNILREWSITSPQKSSLCQYGYSHFTLASSTTALKSLPGKGPPRTFPEVLVTDNERVLLGFYMIVTLFL